MNGLTGGLAAAATPVPTGVGYSVLLVLHVACAVVALGTVGVTGVQAWRARRGPSGRGADGVRRYFRPGVNWAARALYGVPVFGFALVGVSQGAFSAGDGFVVAGLALWLAGAAVAEAVVWPGERRLQVMVSGRWGDPGVAELLDRQCRRVVVGAGSLTALFVVAFVIMVGKP